DLPAGASVRVLPWDSDGSADDAIPEGTVALRIDYPFKLLGSSFSNSTDDSIQVWTGEGGNPVSFGDFTISEKTVALQELYVQ
ncbi:MAG: hypothetical protein K2Z81_27125, partial [Cyanobacteria bacterium]|nr:hypothetical protein [Cyanobacteriota bacterium]